MVCKIHPYFVPLPRWEGDFYERSEYMPGDSVKVGMVASLTGQFSGQGSQALAGAAAWSRDVNETGGVFVGSYGGKLPVSLKHYDDESKAQVARSMTERLIIEDRVDLLLGPYSSVLTLAAAPVAEEHHRVLWNHGGASDQIYSKGYRWVVGVLTPASRYLHGLVDLVRKRDPGPRRVAILHSSRGSFPESVASGVETYAVGKGFQISFKGRYQPPVTDFSPLLEEMDRSGPELIIEVGRIQDDLLLASQIAQRGTKANAVALVAAGINQFGEELGDRALGFMGPSQWEPAGVDTPDYGPSAGELGERLAAFRPGGGDYAMAQAYAAGLVAQRCVEEAGTLDNRVLRETAGRADFTTFYGRFKIDPATGCQVGRSVVIVQWQSGGKVVVWPREMCQGELIYPAPIGAG